MSLRSCALCILVSTVLTSRPPNSAHLPFGETSARVGCLIYQNLASQCPAENIAIAPTNLCEALSMLEAGAQGRSQAQLDAFLAPTFPANMLASEVHCLRRWLMAADDRGGPYLNVANNLFCQQGWHVEEAFRETLSSYYAAVPQSVDFIQDPHGSLHAINHWISTATDHRIPRLLAPGSLTCDTRLVLASTLYFQGDWLVPFDARSTRPRPFYDQHGSLHEIPTMELKGSLRVGAVPGVTAVALPYRGGQGCYSLILAMPDDTAELTALEGRLTPEWIATLSHDMRVQQTHLFLPRFELSSRHSLLSTLEGLGLTALRGRDADFRGIRRDDPPQVSGVEHLVVVNVHEKGTEVAAATCLGMRCTAHPEVRVVRIHKPFLFMLVEEKSGALLVLGRFCKP